MDEQTQFMINFYPLIVQAMKEQGIDPRWAEYVASQGASESRWGKSKGAKENNFFGVKAGKEEQGTYYSTREGYGKNAKTEKAKFKSYNTPKEGIEDGIRNLNIKFNAFEGEPSAEQFVKNINSSPAGVYFTEDPEIYLGNLQSISSGKRMKVAKDAFQKTERQRALNNYINEEQKVVNDATRVARPIALPIRRKAAGGNLFDDGGTTVGEQVDALYSAFPKEEFLGEPSHHYIFTIPEEQADSLGYLPDSRGHRDDRVKLPAHPSSPSRGTWNGNEFQLTDLGMQSPNYTLFGLNDGGQDPQAVLTYKGGAVIPEITVAPNGNYVENPYDNIIMHQKGDGGTLNTPKKWDDLSFQEKSEMMKIAIKNGVYSLPEIKQKYNEYAEGGKIHIDESKKGTFTAAATKHGMGVQEFASKVMSNPEDYSPEMRKKAVFAKNAAKWHCYGGNLFGGGGYKPSEAIKKRIAEHEGKAMTGAKDPLSGKYAKNNSFEAEAKGFYNALPKDIRDQVLSNQGLADNLYSYSYNVGAGNFKKRVVPTLQKYYKGQASIEDIENSMWASGDSKLRGLQRRRAQERAGVRSALWDYQMNGLSTAINNPIPVFMQDPSQVYSNPLATYEAPVVPAVPEQPLVDVAIKDAYTPEKIAEEERKERAVLLGSVLNNFNQSGEYSPFINAINILAGRGYSRGGHLFDGKSEPVNVLYKPEDNVVHRVTRVNGDLVGMDPVTGRFYDNTTGNYIGDHVVLEDTVVTPQNGTIDDMGNIYQTIGGVTHMTTSDGKHIILGEKPVSNVDPVGEFYVEGTALSPLFKPVERVVSGVLGAPEIVKSGKEIIKRVINTTNKNALDTHIFNGALKQTVNSSSGTGILNKTVEAAENGRQALLDAVNSAWNRVRWQAAMPGKNVDIFIKDLSQKVKEVPFDFSKSTKELGAFGAVIPHEPKITTIGNTQIRDYNTGLDVYIGSDLGEAAYPTGIHEPIHYMTSSSHGEPAGYISDGLMGKSYKMYNLPEGNTGMILRGKGYEHKMVDYNDDLLPPVNQHSAAYMAINEPSKLRDILVRNGKSSEEAESLIRSVSNYYRYMLDKQENQTYLKEFFLDKIKPHLKNPNDAAEIENYLKAHPDIIENNTYIKELMTSTRPGSIEDYSKALAKMLYTITGVTAVSGISNTVK